MAWLRRTRARPARAESSGERTTEADIALAYRLVFDREPDAEGLRHYGALAATGMSFRSLVQALLDSSEHQARDSGRQTGAGERAILPAEIIDRFTVEDLAATADAYYRSVTDPTALTVRPFAYLHEAPVMLQSLGALLAGLQLGKTMRVLDFGAGTCWLSRSLAQLGCEPVCCDVSTAALDIGRRLFAEHPPAGSTVGTPVFLPFDGHRIALEAGSVDRIVCFDAFHHVPNPEEILGEFGRVLRAGGIAGFSEPGLHHSRSAQAQSEMRDHRVLENDVDPRAISAAARAHGFTHATVRVQGNLDVSLEDYDAIVGRRRGNAQRAIWADACETMTSRAVFFLHKGEPQRDSRSHTGLAHTLTASAPRDVPRGAPVTIDLTAANTGQATWLSANTPPVGIVRVGTHLYDRDGGLIALDHSRHDLPRDVRPGESIALTIDVPVPADGSFLVGLDLVAEGVIWFEHVGSTPLRVRVR